MSEALMNDTAALPLQFTEAAARKVQHLISDEENPNLKLRVYICLLYTSPSPRDRG